MFHLTLRNLPVEGSRAGRKMSNNLPRQDLCKAKFVTGLKLEPEFGLGPEPMRKAESRVARYRSLAMNDLADAVRRDSDLPGKLCRRNADGSKLFCEKLAWMDRFLWHEQLPFPAVKGVCEL